MPEEFDDPTVPQDQSLESSVAKEAVPTDELAAARETNRALIDRLRDALCATEPAINASMIRGETLEEVEASFADARSLVERVRKQVAAEAVVVSPGAPGRQRQVLASPFEKIRAGLSR